jgi:hypothetical protein
VTENTTSSDQTAAEKITRPLPSYLHNSRLPEAPAAPTTSRQAAKLAASAKPVTLDAIQEAAPDLWDLVKRFSTIPFEDSIVCGCSICAPTRLELDMLRARACFLIRQAEGRG